MLDDSISLNKYISSTGVCSRREADKFIEAGRVRINGKVAKKGNRVLPGQEVTLDGQAVKSKKAKPVYLALNKPIGITTTTDTKDRDNIIDFIGYPKRIFPIGRLDKDSSGLILLTNDGDIVNKILRVENKQEKEYLVQVNRPLTDEFLIKMRNGVSLKGKKTKKCKVIRTGKARFKIYLTQGLNRQIRRMCLVLCYKVVALHRVRVVNINIGDLKVGRWRKLTVPEVTELHAQLKK